MKKSKINTILIAFKLRTEKKSVKEISEIIDEPVDSIKGWFKKYELSDFELKLKQRKDSHPTTSKEGQDKTATTSTQPVVKGEDAT